MVAGKTPQATHARLLAPPAPHPERLRIKNWSHQATSPERLAALDPSDLLPVHCEPSPGSPLLRTTEPEPPAMTTARRLPSRVPHNATDERFIHLVCACYLVFWLTSAINRIVKEQRSYGVVRESTPQPHSLFTGPHRYHRPVQATRRHPAPAGMIRPQYLTEGKLIISMASRRVKPPADFFLSGGAHGAVSGSCSVEECGRFVVVGQVERSGSDAAWSQRQRDDASCLVAQDSTEAAIENQFASG